ncbi:hypothetical protein PV10_04997 [Exophiala mesophila]|uniref:FAM50A/XAP5 C-terminal domain-containing protein n=1 Tax=Exophiala mesophila TaxID=212818 RepID=A0A0D1WWN9_EXOME|nr:uncharacterized protein PV10_04997 [Exophiala mesophila]KIV93810.1 hypothetical protein PV10_04997 [Exophiala mesophila]
MSTPEEAPSRSSTPRGFTAPTATTEDLLKSQTVGLVNLADFRKRRADVLEQKEKEARDGSSGLRTPDVEDSDGALNTTSGQRPKKKKKKAAKGLLSFGGDEEDEDGDNAGNTKISSRPTSASGLRASTEPHLDSSEDTIPRRKLTPNPNSSLPAPRALTKAARTAEALARDKLRKEFLEIQEVVKETEISIPFVFYDGANIPGGRVKVRKGDHIWLFLERCRKVGAELGVAGSGSGGGGSSFKSKEDSKKQWARVGVDDLMCVRGQVIVPHHYEFYYFIANRIPDPAREGRLLFEYSGTASARSQTSETNLLRVPGQDDLEGYNDDPALTKVVDRRWYEKNKHIYPASVWKEFKVGKEFEELAKGRRDAQGNAFFFS